MVSTRGSQGITAAKVERYTPAAAPTTTTKKTTKTKTTTKKTGASGAGRPKANTSKPRAKATTAGRVEKKKATPKKKASVGDKVKGAAKKAAGAVEGKPGKKVWHSAIERDDVSSTME